MDLTLRLVLGLFFFFFFSSRRRHTRSVSAFLLNRSVDKQVSHFVHIPGLSYSGVKSTTECQQSLFESHFASRQSLSDCTVAFLYALFDSQIRRQPYQQRTHPHQHAPEPKAKEMLQ